MEQRKSNKGIWFRVTFLAVTLLAALIIPQRGSSGLIDPENLYGPFTQMTTVQRVLLSNCRIWFVNQMIFFAGLLTVLEVVSAGGERKKNRSLKILFLVLFLISFVSLIYFSAGSVLRLGPYPPMSFSVWMAIFGSGSLWTYVWWGASAVLLQLACKF